jgi:hypothetical protein
MSTFDPGDLTVVSVVFRDKAMLDLNYKLTNALNQGLPLNWVVVRNKPVRWEDWAPEDEKKFKFVEGAESDPLWGPRYRSYHSSAGHDIATMQIKTRFALFMLPDFFAVRRNWIPDVINHMLENRLDFFGLPYHPEKYKEIRYFPRQEGLFVDTARVNLADFEWVPDLAAPRHYNLGERLFLKILGWIDPRRPKIGKAYDCGVRIFLKYKNTPGIRSECAVPVFDPASLHPDRKQMFLDWLLPDQYSIVPKRHGYFTKRGFVDFGLPDLNSLGVEEFMWQDLPYGFHPHGPDSKLKIEPGLMEKTILSFII